MWSSAGKGLTSGFSCMFCSVFDTFPFGVPGQVWDLIVLIPDLYFPLYFPFGMKGIQCLFFVSLWFSVIHKFCYLAYLLCSYKAKCELHAADMKSTLFDLILYVPSTIFQL